MGKVADVPFGLPKGGLVGGECFAPCFELHKHTNVKALCASTTKLRGAVMWSVETPTRSNTKDTVCWGVKTKSHKLKKKLAT